jgi:hypothetical protein
VSASAIFAATVDILKTAVPEAVVVAGIPTTITGAAIVLYAWHDGSSDLLKTTGAVIQRTHVILMRLLIQVTADEQQAEATLLDLHDRLSSAFYQAHTLEGAAATATLRQRDGVGGGGLPAYMVDQGVEYRQRGWSLEATEYLSQTLS